MPPITVFKIERILDAYFLKAMLSSIFIFDNDKLSEIKIEVKIGAD